MEIHEIAPRAISFTKQTQTKYMLFTAQIHIYVQSILRKRTNCKISNLACGKTDKRKQQR